MTKLMQGIDCDNEDNFDVENDNGGGGIAYHQRSTSVGALNGDSCRIGQMRGTMLQDQNQQQKQHALANAISFSPQI